jgi:Secretion system C-terminal sorting domain
MKKILFSLSLFFSITFSLWAQPMCQIHYSGPYNNVPCGVPITYTIASIGWPSGSAIAGQSTVTNCLAGYINDYLIVENGVLNNYNASTGAITITWDCVNCPNPGNAAFFIAEDFATVCQGTKGRQYRILIEEAVQVACQSAPGYCQLSSCQHGACLSVTNSGTSNNCCAQVTFYPSGQYVIINIPAGQTVDACIPGQSVATGYSYLPIICSSGYSYAVSPNSGNDINVATYGSIRKVEKEFGIYPSPANESITIKLPSDFKEQTNIMIYDIAGRLILNNQFDSNSNIQIPTYGWLTGMYLVKTNNKYGQWSQKVMVQH